ncbi:kinase-like domain-containing protein [Rhizophagus irregularis DAOM 181602=DAOM 197198]|uniref:Kinase-like domain-containing protein n=1 Tax=Rhizophagus irregularis (strain DAOM 181602 / DAOM 197198 / MUCL 43194) TaxID=747089 RepID=A0A2P4QCD0_RHIID|nr:kinase-like domain-containing protein [Rhizophagus irregularis DAOM 181602=DAOM 197198]POG75301.1 kinase-like domain-containing protein [Rhizophagus irregularis DAOM 181602=DAOM 197198]|eukprot:XP_025182167.1 kinase-like domain-containing protein [Rhizophagus irregularis DAOM 181602=DAOM 197198]
MMKMDIDLRKYLQQNHKQLTWKDRMKIINEITLALYRIHKEKAIHRDLHSGNILYSQFNDYWYISDLGFCGPADKSSTSIYGNLPYIAPEIIVGRGYNFASDIYSIAMLMWEISFGQPPFMDYEDEHILVYNIIDGIRPKIVPGTPLEYKNLMKECWDADPLKRLDAYALCDRMERINLDYQSMSDELFKSEINNLEVNKVEENYTSSRLFTSKIHNFGNLPEPRNATEVNDFDKLSNEQKDIDIDGKQKKQKLFYDEKEIIQQKMKRQNIGDIDDEDEVYNNPNLHSKLEIPDGKFLNK